MAGQGTPATALLAKRKIRHSTHPYDVSPDAPNYGALVAEALGVPPERVFKSLVTEVDGALTVAVVPVTGELDLKALAAAVGGKRATMADRAAAERATGYVRAGSARSASVGGCPRCWTPRRWRTTPSTSRPAVAASSSNWPRPTWSR